MFPFGIILTLFSWSIGFPIWMAFVLGGLFLLVFLARTTSSDFPPYLLSRNGFVFSFSTSLFPTFRANDDYWWRRESLIPVGGKFCRASYRRIGYRCHNRLYVFWNYLWLHIGYYCGNRWYGNPYNVGEGI